MIIQCPSCSATYDVSDNAPVIGRKVRCTRCSHVWRAEAVNPEAIAEPAIAAASESPFATGPRSDPFGGRGRPERSDSTGSVVASDRVQVGATSAAAAAAAGDSILDEVRRLAKGEAPGAIPVGERAPTRRPAERAPASYQEAADSLARTPATTGRRAAYDPPATSVATTGDGGQGSSFEDPFWQDPPPRGATPDYTRGRTMAAPPPRQEPAMAPARGGSAGLLVGWFALAALVGAVGAIFFTARAEVVRALPGTAALYSSLGMPVNTRGLEFTDFKYVWVTDPKGRPALEIAGVIKNVAEASVRVPSVVFAFQDEEGLELFNWATPVRNSALPPGKTTKFQARIPAPPDAVRSLQLRFAKGR